MWFVNTLNEKKSRKSQVFQGFFALFPRKVKNGGKIAVHRLVKGIFKVLMKKKKEWNF